MRKIASFVLILLIGMMLPIFSASATNGYWDYPVIACDSGEYHFDKETGTLYAYCDPEGTITDLVIPSELAGVAVTAIADEAFSNADLLESVTIPNSVKHIGAGAFFACTALKSIVIPDSVTSIGADAFFQCENLKSAKLGNGITSIPDSMFFDCSALSDITFGKNITSIGESAFYACESLTKLVLPEKLQTIGTAAFLWCSRLADVTFGKSLTSIGEQAFSGCSALKSITLPDSVSHIGELAFSQCDSLASVNLGKSAAFIGCNAFSCGSQFIDFTVDAANEHLSVDENGILFNKNKTELILCPNGYVGTVTIPESVTNIRNWAFFGCTGLTEVTIGKNVKTIGDEAFYACDGLKNLTVPNGVTHFGARAFAYCAELQEVTIGKDVEHIGDHAFNRCEKLAAIHVDEANKHYSSDEKGILYDKEKTVLIQAPTTYVGAYTGPKSLITVKSEAFYNCPGLTSLVLAEGTKVIEDGAFSSCAALENITLPDSLERIGGWAFFLTACYDNNDGDLFYIGNHLIEAYASDPESILGNIAVREGTRTIADYAFEYGDVPTLTLPESLVSIGEYAFHFCNFENITIPKNVSFIGEGAFESCYNLKQINVDAENKHYRSESGVLFNKEKTVLLKFPEVYSGKYVIPSSVTTVADNAFDSVSELTTLTIPKSVAKFGAFIPNEIITLDVYYIGSGDDWAKIDIDAESRLSLEKSILYDYLPVELIKTENPFKDVQKDAYFATPVLWASANKITSGVSATSFAPNASCTRGQIVTFLWRMKGCPEPSTGNNPFKDVKQTAYYYKAVVWASENGIIFGTSATTFAPNAPCTRGQVATLLYRISPDDGSYETENPFKDVAIGDYYYDGVLWAYENGITDGIGSGKFAPNATCTRAQIVTFLFRTFA